MVLVVIALGTHGILHGQSLDAMAVTAVALPGSVAIATTAELAFGPARAGEDPSRADAVLSAVPTALAFGVAFCDLGIVAGKLDALIGIVAVLVQCVRTVDQSRPDAGLNGWNQLNEGQHRMEVT
jgi:hypothetical protein